MKKTIFFMLTVLCLFKTAAQPSETLTKLLLKLDSLPPNVEKLETLIKIDSLLSPKNNKRLFYLQEAEKLAIDVKNDPKLGKIYFKLAIYYGLKSDYNKYLEYALKLMNISEKINDTNNLIRSYVLLGQGLMKLNNQSDKAIAYFSKAESLAIKSKKYSWLADVYMQQGFVAYYAQNYEKALSFYNKAVGLALKYDLKDLANYYIEIGLAYTQLNKPVLAFQNFNKALAIAEKNPEQNLEVFCYTYSDMGLTYSQQKNYPQAIDAFNKSLYYAKQMKNVVTEMENYNYMAEMYGNSNNYKNQNLYLKKYYHLKDSLFSVDKNLEQADLISDFEIEKKNRLVSQKELETTKNKNQRNIFIGIATTSVLLLLLMLNFYSRIQKKNKLISRQKTALEELNKVKDRLFAILSHDLRNPLVTLKSFLTLSTNKSLSAEKLEKYQLQTQQTLTQTTSLLDNLLLWANMQLKNSNPTKKQTNLEEIILDVIDSVKPQASYKNIFFETKFNAILCITNQQIVELAVRNIVSNAIKFSPENSTIQINTFLENNRTLISIQDEGIGLNESQISEILSSKSQSTLGTNQEKGSGLGLFLVVDLLSKIGATLKIESKKNNGSRFEIIL
jgi:two-component system, sensor histidine kinase and response regulator